MATLQIPSNVKCITSGQVPTTTNLKDGEFAFGKVGGVAKLYGNVNGVIIDFTGDSGTIDADTLNALLSGGNNISIDKAVTGEFVEVKTTPNPTFDDVTLNNTLVLGEDTTGSYTSIIESPAHTHDITFRFTYSQTEDVKLSEFLKETGVKTLFGNQSIVGSGNIDLYRHNITIYAGSSLSTAEAVFYITYYSSNNLKVNNLGNLKTLLGGKNKQPGTGYSKISGSEGIYLSLNMAGTSIGGIVVYNPATYEHKVLSFSKRTDWVFQDSVTTV